MDNLNLESAIKTLKSKTSYTSADMKDVLNIYLKATKVDDTVTYAWVLEV